MKKIRKIISVICLFGVFPSMVSVNAEQMYPLKNEYTSGVDNLCIENKTPENDTFIYGFETQNELNGIKSQSCNGQRSISENSYDGKFAIEIKQTKDEYIPIIEFAELQQRNENLCNSKISMALKPMKDANNISFYVRTNSSEEDDNQQQYIPLEIDGKTELSTGNDLKLGEWQNITIDVPLLNPDGVSNTLYMKGNSGAHWIFDNIQAGNNMSCVQNMELSKLAGSNVTLNNGSLMFEKQTGSKFNVRPAILQGKQEITEKLKSINIKATQHDLSGSETETEEPEKSTSLFNESFSSQLWQTVNALGETTEGKKQDSDGNCKITINGDCSAEVSLGNLCTSDRTCAVINVNTSTLKREHYLRLDMFEQDSEAPYFSNTQYLQGQQNIPEVLFILPKIRSNTKIRLSISLDNTISITLNSFEIRSIKESDWRKKISSYAKWSCTAGQSGNPQSIDQMAAYNENEYAINHKMMSGFYSSPSNYTVSTTYSVSGKLVLKTVNLSNSPQRITVNNQSYMLQFGENDILIDSQTANAIFPSNPDVAFISMGVYDEDKNSDTFGYEIVEGLDSVYQWSLDGTTLYYASCVDNNRLHIYDAVTHEDRRIDCAGVSKIIIGESNDKIIVNSAQGGWNTVDTKSGETVKINGAFQMVALGHDNKIYGMTYNVTNTTRGTERTVYEYENGVNKKIVTFTLPYSSDDAYFGMDYAGNCFAIAYRTTTASNSWTVSWYKRKGDAWTFEGSCPLGTSIPYKLEISNDNSKIFCSTLVVDTLSKSIDSTAKSGTRLIDGGILAINQYYNYNTGEKYNITNNSDGSYFYNPISEIICRIKCNRVSRYKISHNKAELLFLLSFDGGNTWKYFKNGRWGEGSKNSVPGYQDMISFGMTAEEVNAVTQKDYDRLYRDKRDILEVQIAAYMNSAYETISPVIDAITITTGLKDDIKKYSIGTERYDKNAYRKVSGIFPIEDFNGNSECYYLLYIGKDWIYTYKEGQITKVSENTEKLLSDIENNWTTIKQYGMNAKELRAVPSEILTNLLVNTEYANNEFGILYAVKGGNKNAISFRLQADREFINTKNTVIEILLNGNDKKIISSADFTNEEIKRFLNWLEIRQNGKGSIFYNFKSDNKQYFINYYMINSINVFDGETYTAVNSSEEGI